MKRRIVGIVSVLIMSGFLMTGCEDTNQSEDVPSQNSFSGKETDEVLQEDASDELKDTSDGMETFEGTDVLSHEKEENSERTDAREETGTLGEEEKNGENVNAGDAGKADVIENGDETGTSEQNQVPEVDTISILLEPFFYEQNETGYTILDIKKHSLEEIIIPDIVTRIEGLNLYGNGRVKTVVIPDSVKHIDNINFSSCRKLESVIFPSRVEYMGTYNFAFSAIKKVVFPEGMTAIIPSCFYKCTSLTEVILPSTLTEIRGEIQKVGSNGVSYEGAFYGCTSLKNITLPYGLKIIGVGAFAETGLAKIVFPDSVTEIGEGAFWGTTNLSSITWPKNLRTIGGNAFRETAITECRIPDGVTLIDFQAFMDCKRLTYIYIPGTVSKIGSSPFSGCDELQEVYIGNGVTGLPFNTFGLAKKMKKITIPASVTSIGESNWPGEEVTIYTPTGSFAESHFSKLPYCYSFVYE